MQPLLQEGMSTDAPAATATITTTPRDQAIPSRTTAYDDVAQSASQQADEEVLRKKMV